MSKFVIQRNIAIGVFTFVPKVFMVKVHVFSIVFRPTFKIFRNENEYRKCNNIILIAPVTIALCKNEL